MTFTTNLAAFTACCAPQVPRPAARAVSLVCRCASHRGPVHLSGQRAASTATPRPLPACPSPQQRPSSGLTRGFSPSGPRIFIITLCNASRVRSFSTLIRLTAWACPKLATAIHAEAHSRIHQPSSRNRLSITADLCDWRVFFQSSTGDCCASTRPSITAGRLVLTTSSTPLSPGLFYCPLPDLLSRSKIHFPVSPDAQSAANYPDSKPLELWSPSYSFSSPARRNPIHGSLPAYRGPGPVSTRPFPTVVPHFFDSPAAAATWTLTPAPIAPQTCRYALSHPSPLRFHPRSTSPYTTNL